jgi:hypothetical protein
MSVFKTLIIIFILLMAILGAVYGIFTVTTKRSETLSVTGVIKTAALTASPRNYCGGAIYLESTNGGPVAGKDTVVRVAVTDPLFSPENLLGNINQVATFNGQYTPGKKCIVKNNCNCDGVLNVSSVGYDYLNYSRSLAYVDSLPTYEGEVRCLTQAGACVPALFTQGGAVFVLDDPTGDFERFFDVGARLRVWASVDARPHQYDDASSFGTLFVSKVQQL